MNTSSERLSARKYVENLAAKGHHSFVSAEARQALGVSANAAKLALYRLATQGLVAQPFRGFYVIVPPEYRALGCLPAEQFIPALMARLGLRYYAGLFSAAWYHGVGGPAPQPFQVVVAKNRRPLACGDVRIAFVARHSVADVPVQSFNTPRGPVLVSTPAATALDLVGYSRDAKALNEAAAAVARLALLIQPAKLLAAAQAVPVAWAQRAGYLLQSAGFTKEAAPLKELVAAHASSTVPLMPGRSVARASRDEDWKLLVNVKLDAV